MRGLRAAAVAVLLCATLGALRLYGGATEVAQVSEVPEIYVPIAAPGAEHEREQPEVDDREPLPRPGVISGIDMDWALAKARRQSFLTVHATRCGRIPATDLEQRSFGAFSVTQPPPESLVVGTLHFFFIVTKTIDGEPRCRGEEDTFIAKLTGTRPARRASVPVRSVGPGLYVAMVRAVEAGPRTLEVSAIWRDGEGFVSLNKYEAEPQSFWRRGLCLWPEPKLTRRASLEFLAGPTTPSPPVLLPCQGEGDVGWAGAGEWVLRPVPPTDGPNAWWFYPYNCHVLPHSPEALYERLDGLWLFLEGDSTLGSTAEALIRALHGTPPRNARYHHNQYVADGRVVTISFNFNGAPKPSGNRYGWISYGSPAFTQRRQKLRARGGDRVPDVFLLEGSLHDLYRAVSKIQSGNKLVARTRTDLEMALNTVILPGLATARMVLQTPPTQGGGPRGRKTRNSGVCGRANPSVQRPASRAFVETVRSRVPDVAVFDWGELSEPLFDSKFSDGSAHYRDDPQLLQARVAVLLSVFPPPRAQSSGTEGSGRNA